MEISSDQAKTNHLFSKNVIQNFLVIFWVLVPALYFLVNKVQDASDFTFYLYYLILFLTFALEVLVMQSYLNSKKAKDLVAILLLGFLLQALWLIAVLVFLFPLTGPSPALGIFFIFLIIFHQLIAPEIGLAIILFILFFVFKKSEKHTKKIIWIGLSIILISGIFIFSNYIKGKKIAEERSQIPYYDFSAASFRSAAKNQTILGKYQRPLRIIKQQNGSFIGVPLNNQHLSLTFLDSIHPDQYRNVFFDIFKDRVFYIQNGKAFMFDIAQKKSTLLPEPIQAALEERAHCDDFPPCNKREIVGAHNNTLALEAYSLANTGDVAVFDITTGKQVQQSIFDGGDDSRIYVFWLHGKGYRFMIDTPFPESGDKGANDQKKSIAMNIYLDHEPDPYHMPSDKEFTEKWGSIFDYSLKKINPIATIQSINGSNDFMGMPFTVRHLYDLQNGEIGLEFENKLVIVNPETQKVRFTSDEQEIEKLLSQAILLSADDEDYFSQGNCADNNEVYQLVNDQKGEFMFCLL